MHDKPIDAGEASTRSNAAQDLRDQGVVLIHVLSIYPTQLRLSELIRELTDGSGDFAERDRIERAVRDLSGAGLLFRCEGVVLPTRAALRFNQILSDEEVGSI
jgi:hypothetical protein